jgi:hypothetical protein
MTQLFNTLNNTLQNLGFLTICGIIFYFAWGFIIAWIIIIYSLGSSGLAAKNRRASIKRWHQIPCSTCKFFSGNYQLICAVQPKIALTEEAINCCDYYPS